MKTEKRIFITYLFPGIFFPEEITKQVKTTDMPTTVPSDSFGFYFTETEYVVDGEKEFVGKTKTLTKTFLIGEAIHVDNIPSIDRGQNTDILKSNIRSNSPTKTGIKTRLGNWQWEDETREAVSPSKFKFGKPEIYKKVET